MENMSGMGRNLEDRIGNTFLEEAHAFFLDIVLVVAGSMHTPG